jgi:hypothetical protein
MGMTHTMEREAVKQAVKEALKEELKEFYVDRETHYQHHEFIKSWMNWTIQSKNIIVKTIIVGVTVFIIGCIAIGFATKMAIISLGK